MITIEDALKIKEFRKTGTWRVVATRAALEWPERNYCSGNQIEGMELCSEASDILGEDLDK